MVYVKAGAGTGVDDSGCGADGSDCGAVLDDAPVVLLRPILLGDASSAAARLGRWVGGRFGGHM